MPANSRTSRWLSVSAILIALTTSALACGGSAPAATAAPVVVNTPVPPTQTPPPTPAPVDLTIGLVAYYPFDGDVLDASGHGHDGQQSGPEFVADAAGAPQSALLFDGVDTVLIQDSDDFNFTGSFSISMLLKGEENPSHQWLLISKHAAGQCRPASPSWFLRFSKASGGLYISQYDQSAECGTHIGYGTAATLDDGQWHSLVLTYDRPSETLRYFVDCQVAFEQSVALNFQDNAQPLVLGNQFNGPESTNFNGVMDEVRIYDLALDDAQIQVLCAGKR